MSNIYQVPPENQPPSQTDLRTKLFRLGYVVIPTRGKRALLKGWNGPDFIKRELTDNAKGSALDHIARWPRRWPHLASTGVRIENGLAAIDIDIDDEAMVGQLLDFIEQIAPDIYNRAPARYGGGRFKLALFVRKAEEGAELAFGRKASRKWFRPGEDSGQRVEIFGGAPARNGNCGHHMGVFGPHGYDDADINPVTWYRWEDGFADLSDIAPADLPVMTTAIALQILTRFDQLAEQAGWTFEKQLDDSASNTAVIYDIDRETTLFDTNHGERLNYENLCNAYDIHGGDLRCTTSFLGESGRDSKRLDHCIVGDNNRHGVVAVYVFGTEQLHFPRDLAPAVDTGTLVIGKLLKEAQKAAPGTLSDRPPPIPRNMTETEKRGSSVPGFQLISERVQWLLTTHAFEAGRVINIYDSGDGMQEKAARSHFMNWRITREGEGPRGGSLPPLAALNFWLDHAERLSTRGRAMRPDMPVPVYREEGALWRNSYQPPRHHEIPVSADQIAEAGWLFSQLVRNVAAGPGEADYLLRHIAHKMQNPSVPGCSILFINPVFGSGRDLLYSIVSRLLGRDNTSKQDISRLIGDGGRASWNAWLTDYVLVYVGEVLDKEHSRSTYDRLKMLVDPRADDQVSISRKHVEEQSGVRYATVWLSTNHADAFKIEEGDRRFSVLMGGPKLDDSLAERLEAWRADPVHIAALWRHLMTVDLAGYRPHEPLETVAKIALLELTMDGVRAAVRLIASDESRRWRVFSLDQLEDMVERRMGLHHGSRADKLRGLSTRHKEARAGLVVPAMRQDGKGQRVIRVRGENTRIFCFAADAKKVAKLDDEALRALLPDGHLSEVLPIKPK